MNQKIGTFNSQGICISAAKQYILVNEVELYKLSALTVQETHIKGYGTMKLTSNTGKHKYFIFPAVKINQKTELVSSYHPMFTQNLILYTKESVK